MATRKSTKVPQKMQDKYEAIVALTDEVCLQYLNEEYAEYARYLTAALARKRPSPIKRGQAKTWAAGVVHALGFVNFLSDMSFQPAMSVSDLWAAFGVSKGAGGAKSRDIRQMFDMYQMDPEWTLPSLMENNALAWMVQTPEGMIIDARSLPAELQHMLAQEGIIPYPPHSPQAESGKTIKPIDGTYEKQCKLCGNIENLTRTPCCNNWICDDVDSYELFSYARNSCYRNHDRYTLCSFHWNEEHDGRWQECPECLENFETEMYVYYATNEYNFEVLKNPPTFEPTRCKNCNRIIDLAEDGYTMSAGGYYCMSCKPHVY